MSKKNIIIMLLVLLTISSSLFAQQISFSRIYYDSTYTNGGTYADGIAKTNDDGFIVAGHIDNNKGLIFKADSNGNLVWSKKIEEFIFYCITAADDSCFILAGITFSDSTNSWVTGIMKIDSNGDSIWSMEIHGNGSDAIRAYSVNPTIDSGFIITGSKYGFLGVIKIDLLGNLEWMKEISTGQGWFNKWEGSSTPDSGYIMIGQAYGNAFMIKLNASGSLIWMKNYDNQLSSLVAYDLEITNDGFLTLFWSYKGIEILKTDFLGNLIWNKIYDISVTCRNCAFNCPKIHWTADSNLVVIVDNLMFKIDTLGNIMWSKDIFLRTFDFVESEENELIIVGNGPLDTGRTNAIGFNHIGLIKIDSLGNNSDCVSAISNFSITYDTITVNNYSPAIINSGISYNIYPNNISTSLSMDSGCVSYGINIEENILNFEFSIFPNPVIDNINCYFNNINGISHLEIIDLLGRTVYSKNLEAYNYQYMTITKKFPPGLYNVILYWSKGVISKKIIIDK